MRYFLIAFQVKDLATKSLVVDLIKSMNFSHEAMGNVWITAGIGKTSDAASIFDYLNRFIDEGDTIIVSQITTPATMRTIHGNVCYSGIEEVMLS